MLLDILEFPDERLRRISEPVTQFDAELKTLVDQMFATMYAAPGVGLAAPQVNRPLRMMVIDVQSQNEAQPLVFVNPEISATEGEIGWEEGCLSVPGFTSEVSRFERVTVKAQDAHGKSFSMDAEGLLAIAVQHELDHLNGVLFVDHLSRLKRQLFLKKYNKVRTQKQRA